MNLLDYLPGIPNFPKPGILFRDISPLLGDPKAFRFVIDQMAELAKGWDYTHIVGIESRGFIFAAALAHHEHKSLVLVRKPGKLPLVTHKEAYGLEYGNDSLEIQAASLPRGSRTVVVDDILATGGTMLAASKLITKIGAELVGGLFMGKIDILNGEKTLKENHIKFKVLISL